MCDTVTTPCGHVLCNPCQKQFSISDDRMKDAAPTIITSRAAETAVATTNATTTSTTKTTSTTTAAQTQPEPQPNPDLSPTQAQDEHKPATQHEPQHDHRREDTDADGARQAQNHCHVCDRSARRIVEIWSEGTGFAGGGDNTVKKGGLAFQC